MTHSAHVIPFPGATSNCEIQYSYGVGAFDNRPQQRTALNFRALAEVFYSTAGPPMPAGLDDAARAAWKATTSIPWIAQPMGGDGRRCKANAQSWPLLILDIDSVASQPSSTAWDTLVELVSAVRQIAPCFGWTTLSHTLERPRARVVLHLSRTVTALEAKRMAVVLNADLSAALSLSVGPEHRNDIVIDRSMQDASHIAFAPLQGSRWIALHEAVAPMDVEAWLDRSDAGVSTLVLESEERPFDPSARPYSPALEIAVRTALERLDRRNPQAVHDRAQWLRVLAALKSYGWADALMEPIAREWSEQSPKFDATRWPTDWESLKIHGGITPATLFYLAGQAEDDCPAFGTDDGTACRLRIWLAGRAMYARGRFYVWTGAYWRPDNGQIASWLKDFAREQADDAARIFHADPTDKTKEARAKTARLLLQQNMQDRVLRAAATMLRVDDSELDRDAYLLACNNGTVNLRDGTLKPPAPNDRITLCTGNDFDPLAKCSGWEMFIREAIGDRETIDWFQRFMGYSATGDVREEKMLLALGPSGTGKSTALKAIMNALGGEIASTSYCTAAASALLSDTGKRRSASEHTGGLTPLVGKRLAAVNEIKRGEAWDDSVFKQLISREPMQMREVGGTRAFNVLPTWKIWVRGNHRPNIRDVTEAFFRRVAVLEFKRKPLRADRGLDEQLRSEASGILAWIVRGAVQWQKNGLALPPAMRAALDSYRSEQDLCGDWLETRTEPGGFTAGDALRHDFAEFAGLTRQPPTEKAFAAMMRERGYDPKKYKGKRGFPLVFKRDVDDAFDPASLA